jgi:hypothetical protein
MWSGILPFRPVLRDLVRNLWVLRFFLLLIGALLLLSCAALAWAEGPQPAAGTSFPEAWVRVLLLTLYGFDGEPHPVTPAGKAAVMLNSLIGKVFLGLLLWVIQQSLSDHPLKKSRYGIFPGGEDL